MGCRAISGSAALVVAVLAMGTLGGCGEEEPASGPPVPKRFFGVNAQFVRELATSGQEAAVEGHLDAIDELGVDFVRANTDWPLLEPRPPAGGRASYEFSAFDSWVEQLARHGLRWQPTGIGVSTPEWAADPAALAECAERSPPKPEAFAGLMAALAGRYGRSGSFWNERPGTPYLPVTTYEVWNEPNHAPFWCPAPDPAAYASTYAATRRALAEVDPRATTLVGGLAGFDGSEPPTEPPTMGVGEFAAGMIAAEPGLARRVDAVGLHPYSGEPAGVVERLARFRADLDAAGLEAPLAVNEVGWPTQGKGGLVPIEEATRAAYVADLTVSIARSDCRVESLALHTWITPETNSADPEHWFGIADPRTFAPRATADAYRQEVRALQGQGPGRPPGDEQPACAAG